MQSARDLLLTARSQQRDIMEQAKEAANGAVSRATAIAERAGSQDPSLRDVEYVRMFAKVAQVQFQAVIDALNEHVNRLGELSGIADGVGHVANGQLTCYWIGKSLRCHTVDDQQAHEVNASRHW